jgi:hypothetical protein
MRKLFLLVLLLSVAIAGCDVKRNAIGEPDVIIVVADSSEWNAVGDTIQSVIAPIIDTPRPEGWYNLRVVPPGQFSNYMDYKNILVVSLLRENSASVNLLDRMLSDEVLQSMQEGNQSVAKKDNPWRAQQLLVIMAAPSAQQMVTVVENRGREVRGYFDEAFNARQKKYLYGQHEQKAKAQEYMEAFDWSIRVPRDWITIKARPDSNFIWIGRHLPIRWMSVYWQDSPDLKMVDSTVAVEMRKTVGQEFYGNIYTNPDYVDVEAVNWNGKDGIRIRGIWAHEREAKGGPFTGFVYYDNESRRLYYLDATIFAPDMEKIVFLRQMEIMMRTFQTASDLPEED